MICGFNDIWMEKLERRDMLSASPLTFSEVAGDGGTQLRIIATNANDAIAVKQTAAGLVITDGAWAQTVNDKIASLYINGEGGNNAIVLDASVTINATLIGGGANDSLVAGNGNNTLFAGTGKSTLQSRNGIDTLVSFGAKAATLIGGNGTDNFWTDNAAAEKVQNAGKGVVHRVASFANANDFTVAGKKVSAVKTKAISVPNSNIKQPGVDPGVSYASFSKDPIFANGGPSVNDIFQGNSGDCYFMAVLSSVAKLDPARITNNILDMGDGTVVIQMNKNGKPLFVREDEQLPVSADGTLYYDGLGQQNCIWAALMEKAFCYIRTGQTNYAAIDTGWMDESYSALGCNPTSTYSAGSAAALLATIGKDLSAGQSVTYATGDDATGDLVSDHAYTVISVGVDARGNPTLTLRNPWGCDINGDGNGYVTISAAAAFKSLVGFVNAKV